MKLTFRYNSYQVDVYKMLVAYAALDSEVGYCQLDCIYKFILVFAGLIKEEKFIWFETWYNLNS